MKRAWMLGAACAILFSMGCNNQKPELTEDFSDLQGADEKSDQFSKKMKLLGSLDYGQTSPSVKYTNSPKYRAYKFGGQKGDQVIIDVASANGDAVAYLTDNAFKVVAKNDDYKDSLDSHIEAKLPGNSNPDIITYYIIFTEYYGDNATFHVSLKKKGCVDNVFCMQGMHFDSNACKCVSDNQFCGGIAGIKCPAGQQCVDNPNDSCDPAHGGADCGGICVPAQQQQTCGGIANIQCPAGQKCVDNPNDSCDPAHGGADCGGICVADDTVHCGGIANIQCPAGQKCVDDPNDSCDPARGGADCGGICVACVQTQLCVQGAHWDSASCACVQDDPCAAVRCAAGTTCVNCFGGARCLASGQVCAF